ncbi:MAG: serine hydrolase domain-containing protein [Bacteroidales bacterium]|jgi:CubicO group peptidase (beta-lactamase class C family)|nr:serine hydrolase domain-containing protein [Bacteroidales bacterium]
MKAKLFIVLLLVSAIAIAQKTDNNSIPDKNIDKYLTYFSNDNPGAVVAVIKDGSIIFNKAYGLSNTETKEVLTTDKAFNLNELSKAFTSVAIMKLVEKKKLSLDQSLTDIFSDFPEYGKNIKIRNLLSHTSGLKPYESKQFSNNLQVYDYLKSQNETAFEPGTKMQYSNADYAMLALVIEKVSKASYQAFLTKNIFKKLSMNNTWIAENKKGFPVADSHFKLDSNYVPKIEVNMIYGEQGIYTNSTDYAKWDKALHSGKILKPELLSQIFTVEKLKNGENNSFYGYGWAVMKRNETRYWWHGGMGHGYTNLVLHLPDNQLTVLILTNRNDGYDFLKMSIAIAKEFDKNLKL